MRATTYLSRPDLETGLDGALAGCREDGRGAIIVVSGEAGIGKSALIARTVEVAEAHGVAPWVAHAREIDQQVAFAALLAVRGQGGEQLFDVAMPLVTLEPGDDDLVVPRASVERVRATERLVEQAEAVGLQPTLLVLEDLHWADDASIEVVGALAEITATHPIVLLISYRSGPRRAAIDDLLGLLTGLGATRLDVPPLSPTEVDTLLPELCGGAPSQSLVDQARGAAGNPFFLVALATGLLEEGVLITRDELVDIDDRSVPKSLVASIEQRLHRLGSDVADLLRAASVQGATVDIEALSSILGSPPLLLSDALGVAQRAGLLEERGDDLVFRHELVREAVYQSMPAPVRAAVHRQMASVLVERSAPAALVGSHLVLAGGDHGDAEAVEFLRRAAVETAPVDPVSALAFLDRASELCRDDSATRQVIERARIDAFTAAGRLDEAERLTLWLLDVSDDEGLTRRLRIRLAGLASIKGDPHAALEHLQLAYASAVDDRQRCTILGAQATAAMLASDFSAAATFAEQAEALAATIGDPVGQSVGLGVRARLATYDNDLTSGLRLGAKAVAIADIDPGGLAHEYMPCLYYGITALNADDLDLAAALAQRGLSLAETHRLAWSLPLYGALAAVCHWHRGELDDARARAESVVALSERTKSTQALLWAESTLALVALEAEGLAEAQLWNDRIRVSLRRRGSQLGLVYAIIAQARVRDAAGQTEEALTDLRATWDFLGSRGSGTRRPFLAWDQFCLARTLGDTELLTETATSTAESAGITRAPRIGALAAFMAAVLSKDTPAAVAALGELRTARRPLEVANWLVEGAVELSDSADPAPAWTEALQLFEQHGARASAERVRGLLNKLGRPPVAEPSLTGWGSLTPTETAIAQLLAQGLTNAEIAQQRGGSRRTVEAHLRRIYRKMQIEGRVKLTVVAAERFG